MNTYDTVIGLEVHVQLNTESKIFCSCATTFDNPPNTNICPVCCGYPGVLPVFNKRALELAVRVGLALHCRINPRIYFERKNYFYPDLPKNYQISQYKMPLGEAGYLEIPSGKKIKITRVHLEEDAGKLVHKENYSLVDFNRTGTPLLEIVTEPDIDDPAQAYEYLTYLKLTLQYIGASECDMERGLLRCDANVSLKPAGSQRLGTKVELKNMNTFRGVRDALSYEVIRQEKVLEEKGAIHQETRLWNAQTLKSEVMRTKEDSHDYRYFPEPDLLDFFVEDSLIEKEKSSIGELPLAMRQRFVASYGLTESEVDTLIDQSELAAFFEKSLQAYNEPKKIANWLLGPFLEQLNTYTQGFSGVKITPDNFAKIVRYFSQDRLNNLAAKKVLILSIATNKDIDTIISEEGLAQVSAFGELDAYVQEAVRANPKAVKEYLEGKEQALMFLVGAVMKQSKGKANPKVVKEMLEKSLKAK